MNVYFYLIVLMLFGVLFLLSARENPLSEKKISGVELLFRRSAVWIYRRYRGIRGRRGKAGRIFPAEEMVRTDLNLLNPSRKAGQKAALYYIDKLQIFLIFLAVADVLAMAVTVSSGQERQITSSGVIERPGYGEKDLELQGIASAQNPEGGETAVLGEYTVHVGAREYTKEETDEMAEKLMNSLPQMILGENRTLSHVTENLNLVRKADGYPFRIRWESSRYEYVDSDGTVGSAMLAEGTRQKVELTAVLTYLDRKYTDSIEVTVCPGEKTADERLSEEIEEALSVSNEATASGTRFYLPEQVNGIRLLWSDPERDRSIAVFVLITAAGAAVFLLRDRDLHRKTEERERQMALDYPQVVSKLVLLIGAGMSINHSFLRIGDDYRRERRKGGRFHYVYEEILLMCREVESGVSERAALQHFGKRCRSQRYTKLVSLLSQSRQKGNDRLLQALSEEADLAFADRRSLARQMGEEAGTKLLLPMTMMLAVTLVMIIVPAYFSFSL